MSGNRKHTTLPEHMPSSHRRYAGWTIDPIRLDAASIGPATAALCELVLGEQAMVSIGRGLMRAPNLLLIDEPSLGLSPILVKENFNMVRRIHERGITVFLVEQNVHQTLAISHFGYVLAKGRVVAAGTPAELASHEEVREAYFG